MSPNWVPVTLFKHVPQLKDETSFPPLIVRPKKRPKNKTALKNNRIVGVMWLGILPDLPKINQAQPAVFKNRFFK